MNKSKKGFSLMELIVVLGVMSIICVIAVPKYLQTVEDSKKSRAMIDAKEVYRAAETLVSQNSNTPTSEEVLAYANAKGKIRQLYFDTNNGNVIIATNDIPFVYAEDDYTVQYADGEWTYLEHYLGNSYTMKSIVNISIANEDRASSYKEASVKHLKDEGIDLKSMGIESWWVLKSGNGTTGELYLSTEKINITEDGKHVFIRYNPINNTYCVVQKMIFAQNKIPEGGYTPYKNDEGISEFNTYEEALELYKSKTSNQ